MKVTFEDGSFLEVLNNEDGTKTVVVCGVNKKQLVMLSSKLTVEQAEQISKFLTNLP